MLLLTFFRRSSRLIGVYLALLLPTITGLGQNAAQRDSAADTSVAASLPEESMWQVVFKEGEGTVSRAGRILLESQDGGILFEDRGGRIYNLTPAVQISRNKTAEPFLRFSADELAESLQQQTGPAYHVHQTPHYVICSNASPGYSEFVGQLLDQLYAEFFEFFADSTSINLKRPDGRLPILIHSTAQQFQEFAKRQHPEISFEDTPGYYSVRDNLVLLLDLTGDSRISSTTAIRRKLSSMPRQVSTLVHEAVHQLAFNSGLQVRMADNPLWLSEGIAVWFETASPRSRFLWSKPGVVSPVHQPMFPAFQQADRLPLSLTTLIGSDSGFLNAEQSAAAYALSWGLTTYLIRQERRGFDNLLMSVSARKPLIPMSAADRILEFEQAVGKSIDEIERAMVPFIARLRVPR